MKYILFFLFFWVSCSSVQDKQLIGDCPPIPLESSPFSSDEGFDTIFVGFDYWHFISDGNDYRIIKPKDEQGYCDNNYCNGNDNEIMKVEGNWFSAKRIDSDKILVYVKRNNTKQKRHSPLIWIQNSIYDDCKGRFYIEQSEELSREINFDFKGGADSVMAEISEWLIFRDITIDGSLVDLLESDIPYVQYEETLSDGTKWLTNYLTYIEGPWFTIKQSDLDRKKIIFSVKQNMSSKTRSFSIYLYDYYKLSYSTCITITQSAE